MSIWILSGMSGAGKATAAAALEAAGAAVVDNLSPGLVQAWAAGARDETAVAVVDARAGEAVRGWVPPAPLRTLFLTAAEAVLVRRLAESVRPHPCAGAGGPVAAVAEEAELLSGLRAAADVIVDTGELSPSDLARRVRELVVPGRAEPALHVTVSSFGFKYGPQPEADWVVDARLLRNPFWEPELRPLTGLDARVREYVLADPRAAELLRRLAELLLWVSDQHAGGARRHLHVAVGCTGGRHRSVVCAEELGRRLRTEGRSVIVRHRDAGRADAR